MGFFSCRSLTALDSFGISIWQDFDKPCKIMPDSIALISPSTSVSNTDGEEAPQKYTPVFLSIGVHGGAQEG